MSATAPEKLNALVFGEFTLHPEERRLSRGEMQVALTATPFNTLLYLIQHRQRVVSKEDLCTGVWGTQVCEHNTIEQTVTQIRRALGDSKAKPRFIQTIRGQGYRFVGHIEESETEDPRTVAVSAHTAPDQPANTLRRRVMKHWARILSCAIAGAIIAVAIVLFFSRAPQGEVVTLDTVANTLVARGNAGEILWRYTFERALAPPSILPGEATDTNWRMQPADLGGEGRVGALVVVTYQHPPFRHGEQEVFCFFPSGKVRWRYKPQAPFAFNPKRQDLNGPWRIAQMLVVPHGTTRHVWLAINHTELWPSYLVELSRDGKPQVRFVSAGLINTLEAFETKTGTYIIAGGVNNEYKMAAIAVLPEAGTPAASPQTKGGAYECVEDCSPQGPYRYILLPRSELDRVTAEYNQVAGITPNGHTVMIKTEEADHPVPVQAFYTFSEAFELLTASYGDGYERAHRTLEALGTLTHSWANCPERQSAALVRMWDAAGRWRDIPVARSQ